MASRRARLRSSARTSIGQVRQNNEDNVHLWQQDEAVLAIVADGMGGAVAGEEASRLAVEAIEEAMNISEQPDLKRFEALDEEKIAQRLREIIRVANQDIMRRAADMPELRGMGTTATLALVRDHQAIVAHVGDSRAYLVSRRDQDIVQVTADHSFVEALVAAGHITQEQAEDHPMKNVLYRALGQTEDVDVDVYFVQMRPGDWLILCSDGLTRHVKPFEIARFALGSDDPDTVSERLIDLANERGGEDNVSVICIFVDDDSPIHEDRTIVLSDLDDDTVIIADKSRIYKNIEPDTLPARPARREKTPDDKFSTLEIDPLDHAISKRSDLHIPSEGDEGHDNLSPEE